MSIYFRAAARAFLFVCPLTLLLLACSDDSKNEASLRDASTAHGACIDYAYDELNITAEATFGWGNTRGVDWVLDKGKAEEARKTVNTWVVIHRTLGPPQNYAIQCIAEFSEGKWSVIEFKHKPMESPGVGEPNF